MVALGKNTLNEDALVHTSRRQSLSISNITRPLKSVRAVLITTTLFLFLYLFYFSFLNSSTVLSTFSKPVELCNPVYNETLGFEAIYAIVLPNREDRKAQLLAAADVTNISVTVVDGVLDQDVKEHPNGWNQDNSGHWEGQLGCLMSHLNIWKKMIHENLASSLIIESDADWDMRVKQSTAGFAEGVRKIADFQFPPKVHQIGEAGSPTLHSSSSGSSQVSNHPRDLPTSPSLNPYGSSWDILYIGSCNARVHGNGRVYSYNDSAAPSPSKTSADGPSLKEYPRHGNTRMVYQPEGAGCTVAYAVSLAGAHKLVERHFADNDDAVDIRMQTACRSDPNMVCVAVFPQIIAQAGSESNMADSQGKEKGKGEERVSAGLDIQISARVNAKMGLKGEAEEWWHREWENGEDGL